MSLTMGVVDGDLRSSLEGLFDDGRLMPVDGIDKAFAVMPVADLPDSSEVVELTVTTDGEDKAGHLSVQRLGKEGLVRIGNYAFVLNGSLAVLSARQARVESSGQLQLDVSFGAPIDPSTVIASYVRRLTSEHVIKPVIPESSTR